MSLLLCRQRAGVPFLHDKLNINIWSEQELCYIIYNYPLLCLGDFCAERLFAWIEKELGLAPLSQRLRLLSKRGEAGANALLLILSECDYYETSEVMSFRQRLTVIVRYSEDERLKAEGSVLYGLGSYNQAYDRFAGAIRAMESDFRKGSANDDRKLREHNRKKADIYCDMAAAKLQLFDEKGALELLDLSRMTYTNERADEMRYLIDGTGEISEEKKEAISRKKDEIREKVLGSRAYREVQAIFEKDKKEMLEDARRLAAAWKHSYRRM